MEFFHATIYWSGYGEIITNVAEVPNTTSGELADLNGEYAILWISLKDIEIEKIRTYLENESGKSISNDEFENQMSLAFYNGSPVESWFNLGKFLRVCEQLQIKPIMFFYQYKHILTFNKE